MRYSIAISRGRAVVARQAHNLEVAGANPAPATSMKKDVPQGTSFSISGLAGSRALMSGAKKRLSDP
ncbi:MAG: hypothetical protein RLY47_589 [Candidatus Parcubacteria bacterium]